MIDALAERWAGVLKRANPDTPSVAVMKYGLQVVLNGVFIVGLAMLIGLIAGKPGSTALALLGFSVLRQATGGYHLKTSEGCIVLSTVMVVLVPWLPAPWIWQMSTISVLLILWLAPAHIEEQSRIPRRYFPYLKWGSAVLVALNFWIQSEVLAWCFLIQSLSLLDKLKKRSADEVG